MSPLPNFLQKNSLPRSAFPLTLEVRCRCTENLPLPPTSSPATSCNSRSIITISSIERVVQIFVVVIVVVGIYMYVFFREKKKNKGEEVRKEGKESLKKSVFVCVARYSKKKQIEKGK